MASDFLAKAASHVEKASRQDYGDSDMTTLPPETPLAGEWDDEPGKPFSEGNTDTDASTDKGSHGVGTGVVGREKGASDAPTRAAAAAATAAAAQAEALNDALRPLDRQVENSDRRVPCVMLGLFEVPV